MWISLVVLIITLPILKKLAFIPAFLIGLIAFVMCVYIDKKKNPSK